MITNKEDKKKWFRKYLFGWEETQRAEKTYFSSIDQQFRMEGIPIQTLFYIVGKSNVGKTKLIVNMIYNILVYGKSKILFFSLEEKEENIYDQIVRLSFGVKDDDELKHILRFEKKKIIENLEDINFFNRLTIWEHAGAMFDIVKDEEPDFIFIDHFHLVNLGRNFKTLYDKTEAIGEALLNLKKIYNTRVICLVQRKRTTEKYPGAELPFFEDALGSGSIEGQCDVWMGICRPEIAPGCDKTYEREIHAVIRKNRHKNPFMKERLIRWAYEPYSTKLMELNEKDIVGGML